MNGFIVVGTDTDAGKTAFSALFLSAFREHFDYWKPVETGDPDSLRIERLVPGTVVHEPHARFIEPVAPALAAQRERRSMPGVQEIAAAIPRSPKPLLIETFGGPLSPLTDNALQIDLIHALDRPAVLITPATVGAIGRTLAALRVLTAGGVRTVAVVIIGRTDEFAIDQIAHHAPGVRVESMQMPDGDWTPESLRVAANDQLARLRNLRACLGKHVGLSAPRSGGEGVASQRHDPSPNPPEPSPPSRPGQERDHRTPPAPLCAEGAIISPSPLFDTHNLARRDRAALWHPYTALGDPTAPLPVVASEREFLHLADGRTLIDAISSWWTILHGHRHPPLVEALTAATRALDHVLFAGATHAPAIELAERMLATAPWSGGRVFYSDNGSTAVEVALKMAYQFWCLRGERERTRFVCFEDGYHGDTFGAMAIGRDPVFFGRFEPFLFQVIRVPVSADRLDEVLRANAMTVGAVILEPLVQAASGMRMHSPDELRALFAVAKRHGVLFIADEVMTAFRTGQIWAHTLAGIAPDLICTAKTLAGGMLPLAATLVAPMVAAAFDSPDRTKTFFHGHSFTANPLACATAVANWRLIASGAWKDDADRIAAFWQLHLEPMRGRRGVKDVRRCGTIAAVELDAPGGYLAEVGARMRAIALERGVLLRPLGSVVYTLPPLCTTDDSLWRIVAAITAAIESVTA